MAITGAKPGADSRVVGILQMSTRSQNARPGTQSGALRDLERSLQPAANDVQVPATLIRDFGLVEGAKVTGTVRESRAGRELISVEDICGLTPEKFRLRKPFAQLTAVNPQARFPVATNNEMSMRIVDLIAPIGQGTRGLIVAPPKTGKTILLEQLARALHAADPAIRIILLLVDERPEEVTHFRRALNAEVFASSNDQSLPEHIALIELVMAHMRVELECGHNVVVLVDSLTRMARAYNLQGSGSRRTLSGGMDAGALEIPRRFFGLARKVEHGGSITILATALVQTNSRMDDLIFQEFKGTGNSELILDRELAEARIFPAINLTASGTRREELLYSADELAKLAKLRRSLAARKPKEAMQGLLKLLEQTKDNADFLKRIK